MRRGFIASTLLSVVPDHQSRRTISRAGPRSPTTTAGGDPVISAVTRSPHSGANVKEYVPPTTNIPDIPGTSPMTGISSGLEANGPAQPRTPRPAPTVGRIRRTCARLPSILAGSTSADSVGENGPAGQPPPPLVWASSG